MQRDTLVFDIINQELQRQRRGIELIASENFTSLQVMQATGGVMANKYAEGYPGRRYYGGCEIVDKTETLAIDRLKEIFGLELSAMVFRRLLMTTSHFIVMTLNFLRTRRFTLFM